MFALFNLTSLPTLWQYVYLAVFYTDSLLSSFLGYQLTLMVMSEFFILTMCSVYESEITDIPKRPKTRPTVQAAETCLRDYSDWVYTLNEWIFNSLGEKKPFNASLEGTISLDILYFTVKVTWHSRYAIGEAGILLGWGVIQNWTCKSKDFY